MEYRDKLSCLWLHNSVLTRFDCSGRCDMYANSVRTREAVRCLSNPQTLRSRCAELLAAMTSPAVVDQVMKGFQIRCALVSEPVLLHGQLPKIDKSTSMPSNGEIFVGLLVLCSLGYGSAFGFYIHFIGFVAGQLVYNSPVSCVHFLPYVSEFLVFGRDSRVDFNLPTSNGAASGYRELLLTNPDSTLLDNSQATTLAFKLACRDSRVDFNLPTSNGAASGYRELLLTNPDSTLLDNSQATTLAFKLACNFYHLAHRGHHFNNPPTAMSRTTFFEVAVLDANTREQICFLDKVFLAEYIGPLLTYLLFYFRVPYIYSHRYASTSSPHPVVTRACACHTFHYVKRMIETIFVHRFTHGTMPLRIIVRHINSRLSVFTAYGEIQFNYGLIMFVVRILTS
ncbi:hypothetical protein F2P81_019363 [Scophthalmus maximus]|uniref:Uncharacterized protein n=1 Tax=Scophthalmus maximus TaxID=52904 RepID=A0A6A4RZF7_SCOMX|nr:hypothetical protein F2P81_019363 [Scophthalmus maximus]